MAKKLLEWGFRNFDYRVLFANLAVVPFWAAWPFETLVLPRFSVGRLPDTNAVQRDDLVAVQTPQAFRRSVLQAAHAGAGLETDDAALVEAAGGSVVVVEGEPRNLKLTRVDDLEITQALIQGARA